MHDTDRGVAQRASSAPTSTRLCSVPGCQRPTQRYAGKGVSDRYCNMHVQRFARAGTYSGVPLSGYLVVPYRRAARAWIKAHGTESGLQAMVRGVALCMRSGNSDAMALWGSSLTPVRKAEAVRGWLHAGGATPEDVLAVVLGVLALCRQRGVIGYEYIAVQVGRAVMRKHGPMARAKRVHPSGRVLRHLGKQLMFFVGMFSDPNCLNEIVAAAQPCVATAERAEERRRERQAERKRAREAIARRINQARDWGIGPQELERLRTDLMQRYGLGRL